MGDNRLARFGEFEVDLETGELRRGGVNVKLQEQPFRLLALLLERAGELVTRDQIQERLWPADTFVDFEHSLNAAVRKLRTAIGDSADTPRFIETLPGRGYRFIAPVEFNERETERKNRWPWIAVPIVLIVAVFLIWRMTRHAPPSIRSVAVLPFVNLSGNPDNEYLSDAISDEIINALGRVPDVRVVARSSSFTFKGRNLDVRDIGRRLGVATVVEGSMQKSGNRLRVSAKLVDVEDGFNYWSRRFDREMTDVFAIEDDIATSVASALTRMRGGAALVKAPTADLEAYALYMRGRSAAGTRTKERFDQAINYYRAALARDPQLAEAWAGLADLYSQMDHGVGLTTMKPAETYKLAIEAADKALAIDPSLAEAHAAMGHIQTHLGHLAEAEKHLLKAIELNPNSVVARIWYANLLRVQHRFAEAKPQYARALDADPMSTLVSKMGAMNGWMMGDYAAGAGAAAKGILADPDDGDLYMYLARNDASMRKVRDAMAAIDRGASAKNQTTFLDEERALVVALDGRKDEARQMLAAIERDKPQPVAASMFRAYAAAGDNDNAARWLAQLVSDNPEYARLSIDLPDHPAFASFRADPRYIDTRKRLGLP